MGNPGKNQNNILNYKIVKCKNFEKDGTCKYGQHCTFAHGDKDLRNKTENMYHWIIEKKSNKQICIKLTLDDIMKNPYHLNAQVLTEDNILYCVGYVNVENMDVLNNNPSVVLVDLKKIFE